MTFSKRLSYSVNNIGKTLESTGYLMVSKKNIIEVEIAGTPLKLKTSNDESLVKELVQLVDSKVNLALDASQSRSIQNATLIAALNIAEELILLKRKARTELDRLGRQTDQIITDLESSQITQAEFDC